MDTVGGRYWVGSEVCLGDIELDEDLKEIFPRLHDGRHCVTSDSSFAYNCVAWAAGDDSLCWWPVTDPTYYWPAGLPRDVTLENFVRAFSTLGYTPCQSAELEPRFEKIALYVDSDGVPSHAARQLKSGRWTSKLGDFEDIRHDTLDALESVAPGQAYGTVAQIMRRQVPSESSASLVVST